MLSVPDMSTGLSKVGEALSLVFVVSLVALVIELVYVLWRRRFFSRQTTSVDGGGDRRNFSRNSLPTSSASKELLYFLCWKQHQSRVEPNSGVGGSNPETAADGPSPEDSTEVIDILKLQAMRGPSRVLFTIKEEDREDADSEKSESSAVKFPNKTRRLSLEECFNDAGDSPGEVTVFVVGDRETTPYSTPCGSPLYYTPTASPIREFG